MGLSAVVYRRLEEVPLPPGANLDALRIDEDTGEVFFENDVVPLKPDVVQAIHRRLGNITGIALLRSEITEILGTGGHKSVLASQVLYSGTHGGDLIAIEDLPRLKREILLVRQRVAARRISSADTSDLRQLVESFLADMTDLVATSEQQGNPIVFT